MGKLIKLYFLNTLKLNLFRTGPKKNRMIAFALLMALAGVSVLISVGSYAWLLGSSLEPHGLAAFMPAVFMVASSVLILLFTIFSASGILFAFKDYDILMSLPVKTSDLVASRLFALYISELLFALALNVPALAVYAILVQPEPLFYPLALISVLLIPLIPVISGSLLGILVSVVSSRFRKTGIVKILATLILSFGLMFLSFSMNSFDENAATALAAAMSTISSKYPPVTLYINTLLGDFTAFILFSIISLALFALFAMAAAKLFKPLNSSASAVYTKGNYVLREVKFSGPQTALYFKELRTYFGIPLYVLNTAFGMIMLIILAIAAAVIGYDKVAAYIGMPELIDSFISLLPFITALLVAMTPTTCCSLSLEGKRIWLLKTLPVKPSAIFNAKIAVNLTITLPAIIISNLILAFTLTPDPSTLFFMFLTPVVYAFFIASFGLAVNLNLPLLDWKNEMQVVKRSAATMITTFSGMASGLIPIIIMFNLNSPAVPLLTTIIIALLTVCILLYLYKPGAKKLLSLG